MVWFIKKVGNKNIHYTQDVAILQNIFYRIMYLYVNFILFIKTKILIIFHTVVVNKCKLITVLDFRGIKTLQLYSNVIMIVSILNESTNDMRIKNDLYFKSILNNNCQCGKNGPNK